MNEKRIREVVEVERQAQDLLAQAAREAEQIPARAESEAREAIERARTAAREEARRVLDEARSLDEVAAITSAAQQKMGESERTADKNLERAVAFVLERVLGKA